MKSSLYIVASILLFVTSASVEAMTADDYLKTKELSIGNDDIARSSGLTIMAYEQGLADAFWLMALSNSNKIIFSENTRACLPSSNILSGQLVSIAIGTMIGSPANPKEIVPGLKKAPLSALAVSGLAKIFPCAP